MRIRRWSVVASVLGVVMLMAAAPAGAIMGAEPSSDLSPPAEIVPLTPSALFHAGDVAACGVGDACSLTPDHPPGLDLPSPREGLLEDHRRRIAAPSLVANFVRRSGGRAAEARLRAEAILKSVKGKCVGGICAADVLAAAGTVPGAFAVNQHSVGTTQGIRLLSTPPQPVPGAGWRPPLLTIPLTL